MLKKLIPYSNNLFIANDGYVYNTHNKRLKPWVTKDGYYRINIYSKKLKKNINKTLHLLVVEAFLNGGKYKGDTHLQVNHKDGNKKNNNVSNLEIITPAENVNHAHNMGLYTYDLKIKIRDIKNHKYLKFRSLREFSRYINMSLNYIRTRLRTSYVFPILGRYIAIVDYKKYINHISKIKNNKKIYVYDHVLNKKIVLTSFTQISILFSISYINVGKKLNNNINSYHYVGGYTFTLNIDIVYPDISKKDALEDRIKILNKNKYTC